MGVSQNLAPLQVVSYLLVSAKITIQKRTSALRNTHFVLSILLLKQRVPTSVQGQPQHLQRAQSCNATGKRAVGHCQGLTFAKAGKQASSLQGERRSDPTKELGRPNPSQAFMQVAKCSRPCLSGNLWRVQRIIYPSEM